MNPFHGDHGVALFGELAHDGDDWPDLGVDACLPQNDADKVAGAVDLLVRAESIARCCEFSAPVLDLDDKDSGGRDGQGIELGGHDRLTAIVDVTRSSEPQVMEDSAGARQLESSLDYGHFRYGAGKWIRSDDLLESLQVCANLAFDALRHRRGVEKFLDGLFFGSGFVFDVVEGLAEAYLVLRKYPIEARGSASIPKTTIFHPLHVPGHLVQLRADSLLDRLWCRLQLNQPAIELGPLLIGDFGGRLDCGHLDRLQSLLAGLDTLLEVRRPGSALELRESIQHLHDIFPGPAGAGDVVRARAASVRERGVRYSDRGERGLLRGRGPVDSGYRGVDVDFPLPPSPSQSIAAISDRCPQLAMPTAMNIVTTSLIIATMTKPKKMATIATKPAIASTSAEFPLFRLRATSILQILLGVLSQILYRRDGFKL